MYREISERITSGDKCHHIINKLLKSKLFSSPKLKLNKLSEINNYLRVRNMVYNIR